MAEWLRQWILSRATQCGFKKKQGGPASQFATGLLWPHLSFAHRDKIDLITIL